MTRETSIEAYETIKINGLLRYRKWQVYDYVFNNGPRTARQVWKSIDPEAPTGSINTRLSELRDLGVIHEVGTQLDETTGMTVILWDVTAGLPTRRLPKISKTRRAWNQGYEAGRRAGYQECLHGSKQGQSNYGGSEDMLF